MKYRKLPVEVEAWKIADLVTIAKKSWADLPIQVKSYYEKGNIIFCPDSVRVFTLEDWTTGDIGDMLICGVAGELYPCKPEIFAATYEALE